MHLQLKDLSLVAVTAVEFPVTKRKMCFLPIRFTNFRKKLEQGKWRFRELQVNLPVSVSELYKTTTRGLCCHERRLTAKTVLKEY